MFQLGQRKNRMTMEESVESPIDDKVSNLKRKYESIVRQTDNI